MDRAGAGCVRVVAGSREHGQSTRGRGTPVPHPGCPQRAQSAGPPEPEVTGGAGKVVGVPQAEDVAGNSTHGRC